MDKDDKWAEFARIHAKADSPILSDRTWAIDETLEAMLDAIEQEEAISALKVDNLIANRTGKHRRRRASFAKHSPQLTASPANDNDRIQARSALRDSLCRCTDREQRVLTLVGLGHTYREIAKAEGTPEATVKTWVRRARFKLIAHSSRDPLSTETQSNGGARREATTAP